MRAAPTAEVSSDSNEDDDDEEEEEAPKEGTEEGAPKAEEEEAAPNGAAEEAEGAPNAEGAAEGAPNGVAEDVPKAAEELAAGAPNGAADEEEAEGAPKEGVADAPNGAAEELEEGAPNGVAEELAEGTPNGVADEGADEGAPNGAAEDVPKAGVADAPNGAADVLEEGAPKLAAEEKVEGAPKGAAEDVPKAGADALMDGVVVDAPNGAAANVALEEGAPKEGTVEAEVEDVALERAPKAGIVEAGIADAPNGAAEVLEEGAPKAAVEEAEEALKEGVVDVPKVTDGAPSAGVVVDVPKAGAEVEGAPKVETPNAEEVPEASAGILRAGVEVVGVGAFVVPNTGALNPEAGVEDAGADVLAPAMGSVKDPVVASDDGAEPKETDVPGINPALGPAFEDVTLLRLNAAVVSAGFTGGNDPKAVVGAEDGANKSAVRASEELGATNDVLVAGVML